MICFHCFQEIDKELYICNNIRCTSPTKEVVPNISGGKRVCPTCGKKVGFRICPNCKCQIPFDQENQKNIFYAIAGVRGCGKTHYMTVLIDRMKELSNEFEWNIQGIGDTEEIYRTNYYNPLFKNHTTLEGTDPLSIRKDYDVLSYRLKLKNGKTIYLHFIDTAGEDVRDIRGTSAIGNYLSYAQGLIYIIDPTICDGVSDVVGSGHGADEDTDYISTFNSICQTIRSFNRIGDKKKIPIPLAIVMAKVDVLLREPKSQEEMSALLGPESAINKPRVKGRFDEENSYAIDQEIRGYIGKYSSGQINQAAESEFKVSRFFGVSALGKDPEGKRIDKIEPLRVEDPILWLIYGKNTKTDKFPDLPDLFHRR